MKKPCISVIMSVYNGERFLRDAINSILNQTFTDFEFIITNDGSTDGVPHLLNEFMKKDSRIIVFHQKNLGLTESLNKMIKKAKGEYIARMDADDISFQRKFEKQIEKLQSDKNCMVTGCWYQLINENNKPQYEIFFPDKHKCLRRYLNKGRTCYAHGSVMMRREIFEEQDFSYRFKFGQDFDLWLNLSEQSHLGMVEEVLYQLRNHSNAISFSIIPRRAALMKLMQTLSNERNIYGKEVTNWKEEEAKILKYIPLLTKKEIEAYNNYFQAILLFKSGGNSEARRVLSQIQNDLKHFKMSAVLYYLSFLPKFITIPFLKYRDKMNCKRFILKS